MTPTDGVHSVPHHHEQPEFHNEDVAHEHTDVNIKAILMFAAGLVLVAIVVHFLIAGVFWWLEREARKRDPQLSPVNAQAPAMPRTTTESPFFGHARGGSQLLTNEPLALQKVRDDENKRLQGYGWVQGKQGVAHMPVNEAKKLILERGLPARADGVADPALGTRAAAMGEASGGRTIPGAAKGPQTTPAQPQEQQQKQAPAAPHSGHQ